MTNLPISGQFNITATYGQKGKYWANGHKGIDFTSSNKNIYATCDGTVRVVAFDPNGWGQYVSIGDSSNKRHLFCHLVKGSVKVKVGQKVNRTTLIGTMGTTGNSTGVHLHYQINNASGVALDPTPHLGIPNKVGTYKSSDYHIVKPYKDDGYIASWAKTAVYDLKKAGIMSGNSDGTFKPVSNITRQEMALIISNACKVKGYTFAATGSSTKFKDDAKIASWAKTAVYDLKKKKIVNGDTSGRFNPTNTITRQEAAVLVNNVFGKKLSMPKKYLDDVLIPEWARQAVYNLKAAGIMKGNSVNMFNPKNSLTRQEAAVLVHNLIKTK